MKKAMEVFTKMEAAGQDVIQKEKALQNAEEKEPDSKEYVVGGDWLDIKCSEGPAIYYEAGESNYVRIGAKTYYTSDDTAKEFKEYVLSFLENGGYWG